MSKWKVVCSAAVFAAALAPVAHADEYTKLTMLTFSAPVDVPGITLPAGTYRFALADPESGRRAIKVSDKDGTKTYGIFLSIPNERMTPTDKPVVMFKEAAAGAPPAVQVWFYPAESYGYEFVYPHDQALKIARATHEPVLAQTDSDVARIDENDRPVSADAELKESSERHTPVATDSHTATAESQTATSTSPSTSPTSSTTATPAAVPETAPTTETETAAATASIAQTSASQPTSPASTTSPATASTAPMTAPTTAATTAPPTAPATASATAHTTAPTSAPTSAPTAVGTSGTLPAPAPTTASQAGTAPPSASQPQSATAPVRKHLPRTASQLPLLTLLSALSLTGALGVRLARQQMN